MATDDTAVFTLQLDDSGLKGPTANAASALADLKSKIDGDTAALAEMNRAMRNLKGGTQTNIAAFRELRDRITAQKQAIASSQAAYVAAGGSFKKTAAITDATASSFDDFAKTANGIPGPLARIGGTLSTLKTLFASGGVAIAGIALGIAAAMAAVSAAIVTATAALVRYGIAQSDAARNELLQLEGLTTIRNMYGVAAGSASELQAAIDRVSDSASIGRGEVNAYAQRLYRAGLRGADLQNALEGVATVASVQGTGRADRFLGMAVGAARAGHSVRALTDDIQRRLGPIAARQFVGLASQSRRLQQSVERIFGGLKIEGFLTALSKVTDLFSQTTITGRALKVLVEGFAQPLIDGFAAAGPIVTNFFQGALIAALDLQIAYLRLRIRLQEAFGNSTLFRNMDTLKAATFAGRIALAGFVAVGLTAAIVMGALAAAVAVVAAGLVVMFAPAIAIGAALNFAFWAGEQLVKFFVETDWSAAGRNMITGLVAGLLKGRDMVVSTVRSIASSATEALRDALDIHSPSRVFANLGMQIPRGLAAGVEAGAPAANSAVGSMMEIPTSTSGPYRSPASGSAPRTVISFGDIIINGVNAADAPGIAASIYDEVAKLFEGEKIAMGAA